ncbi:MAG: hypothetical protein WBD16_09460 [Pyrinomonadaceae bacterium]
MKKTTSAFLAIVMATIPIFADFKLRQQVTSGTGKDTFTHERSVWVKGARERSENKIVTDNPQMAAMMPVIAEVRQCDLRQTLKINDRAKKYFIVPFADFEDKPLPSVRPSTTTETRTGGTLTSTYTLTDTGERRQMFGLNARHLIIKQTMESTKDSCGGESATRITEDGWYVYLQPETAKCPVDLPRNERTERRDIKPSCRDRYVTRGTPQNPGMMLEGTTTIADLIRKTEVTTSVKTLDLSKAALEMSLFEIPAGYALADSEQSLMSINYGDMTGAYPKQPTGTPTTPTTTQTNRKSVAVNFFSGQVSKIDQPAFRQYLAQQISAAGANGVVITSPADTDSGAYANVIGVEIKSAKESGAAKIGGLFGKVTGTDASKLGKSEAEIVITLYDKSGTTVVATGTAKEKVDGKSDAAVRAAIDKALASVLPKLK